MIKAWQQRWRQRDKQSEFPLFINRIVTNYLIRWHDIRKADYVGILVTDNRGALVVSSIPQVEYYYGKTAWWQAVDEARTGKVLRQRHLLRPRLRHPRGECGGRRSSRMAVGRVSARSLFCSGAIPCFIPIGKSTVGQTGHAMLFNSDGVSLICPVLSPEEHAVKPELVDAISAARPAGLCGGRLAWRHDALIGFAPVRFSELLDAGQYGRQAMGDVHSAGSGRVLCASLASRRPGLLYGLLVFAVLLLTGLTVARRIARPIGLLHEGVRRIASGRLDQQLADSRPAMKSSNWPEPSTRWRPI